MIAYTDYPLVHLGDVSGQVAPIRKVKIISFDGNKYCNVCIDVGFVEDGYLHSFTSIKSGYIYSEPGHYGEVSAIDKKQLAKLIYNKSARCSYRKQLFKNRHNGKFWS